MLLKQWEGVETLFLSIHMTSVNPMHNAHVCYFNNVFRF
jgi:hypothetical protein